MFNSSNQSVVGLVGRVSLAIPVAGPGEVVVVIRGGTERFAAWADEPLSRNEKVLVTEQISARSVQVTPLLL